MRGFFFFKCLSDPYQDREEGCFLGLTDKFGGCRWNRTTSQRRGIYSALILTQYLYYIQIWKREKDLNLRVQDSKSRALTNLATPLRWSQDMKSLAPCQHLLS